MKTVVTTSVVEIGYLSTEVVTIPHNEQDENDKLKGNL